MNPTWRSPCGRAELWLGDALEALRGIPSESINCCVTSPPYYGLRDYGVDGQIGLERTPEEYVARLVAVFADVRRVLRDDGVLWVNLGDSYAASQSNNGGCSPRSTLGGGGGRYRSGSKNEAAYNATISRKIEHGLKPKDLIGIPWAVAQALRAPYYTGDIKKERDRIWLAATLDAEGSICGFTHVRSDDGSTRTGVHVTITNTSELLLNEADRIWKASRVEHENHGQSHYGFRPSWRWVAHGAERKAMLMRELYPYLISKREQARLAYAFFLLSIDAKRLGHSPQRDETRGRRGWIVDTLSRLNRGECVDVPSWIGEPPSVEEPGWYLRSDIIWAKPNPMPESVRDRPTKAHEYIFLLSKSQRYFYDADAISEPAICGGDLGLLRRPIGDDDPSVAWHAKSVRTRQMNGVDSKTAGPQYRNRRTVWTVATKPFPGAHFATFPPELIEPCILAGCPEGGTVLDPFGGSGTTGAVALSLGRRAALIELNPAYCEMAQERMEKVTHEPDMFVEQARAEATQPDLLEAQP